MNNTQYKRASGLYYSREEAEAAVKELKESGYDMDRISVIARDDDTVGGEATNREIGNKADEGATAGAVTGGALGGITGLLIGLGALAIPGIGPILLAGAEATAIATTLAGVGIGAAAGGLVGALIGLGIPEEKAKLYSDRVGRGSFLVMVTGTPAEIDSAANIMRRHGVEEFDIHNAATPASTPVANVETPVYSNNDSLETPVATAATTTTTSSPVDADKIKLYEERLVVDKEREKTGEVAIGKKVETETASVSVPIEKERIVIERTNVVDETLINPSEIDFQNNEVTRFDVYEESAEIEKQTFVREEVTIRKEITQDTVEAREELRHEELEVEAEGNVVQQ